MTLFICREKKKKKSGLLAHYLRIMHEDTMHVHVNFFVYAHCFTPFFILFTSNISFKQELNHGKDLDQVIGEFSEAM